MSVVPPRRLSSLVVALTVGCGASGTAPATSPSVASSSPAQRVEVPVSPSRPPRVDAAPAPPLSAPAPPPPTPATRGVVRFACDDKYQQTPPCDETKWIASIAKDPFSSDLLRHDAGGPNGAIWNGDAPMFIVTREAVKGASMGGIALSPVVASGLRVFRISPATWKRALRPSKGRAYSIATVELDAAKLGEIWFAEGE